MKKHQAKENISFDTEDLIKRYGDRRAYEWFVRAQDIWYWERTQNLVKSENKKATKLVGASIVAAGMAIMISLFSLIRKSR